MSDVVHPGEHHNAPEVPPREAPFPTGKGLNRGSTAWAIFEGGRNPLVILITIYVFMPYVATVMAPNPVAGQALVAGLNTWGGWAAALTAPLLGASIDGIGRRKPLLFFVVALMVPLNFALWWAKPDGTGLSLTQVAWMVAFAGVLFAYTEVLHNSLLVRAAGVEGAPAASGLALALGNGVSVVALMFVLYAFVLPGKVDWGWVPPAPLFGLDPAQHEHDRITAPIAAVLLALGSIPLFLFTPDAPRTGLPLGAALGQGLANLRGMVGLLKGHRDAAVFLLSRMFYADGKGALLVFGGVYAAGVMGWGALQLLAYGVILSVFAVAGGFFGAWLDHRVGPKRAVQIEIVGSLACLVGQLGMARDRLFYVVAYDPAAQPPLWNGPMFTTAPEVAYLLIGFGTAIFITAAYASSRSLLTRLIPADRAGGFFGLYALSGTVTAWLGPALVTAATVAFGSQQGGFVPIAGLLVVGLIGLSFVKGGGRGQYLVT